MDKVLTLIFKEIRDGFRNRWVVMITVVMALLALTLSFLGSAPMGATSISPLAVTVVSLSSLSIFFIPLIALLLAYDSIVGEAERGTLTLLLVYPISRNQIIIGKFIGHLILLSLAILIGYSAAGLAIALSSETHFLEHNWQSFIMLLSSSIILGAVFLSVGYVISAGVKDRSTAAAIAIGVWLVFVLLYDMGLLAILAADSGQIMGAELVKWLMLVNPTDSYRMYNLTSTNETALLSGMTGLSAENKVSDYILGLIMLAWIVAPLSLAGFILKRRVI
ncbi:MAG: ABC transporter permease [Rhizobiales bacterium]|nr:ABC transporter permease [Hyphomicrobiales bacterium]NRB14484.1 ABC transporter permease [Hyphomicrobiales bacterium]